MPAILKAIISLIALMNSEMSDEELKQQINVSVRDYVEEYGSQAVITLDEWQQICSACNQVVVFVRHKVRSYRPH